MKKALEKKDQIEVISFEKGIERLEQIVNDLDQNKVPLEHALDLFQEGITLVRHCNNLLDSADAKVKVLLEDCSSELSKGKLTILGEF